MSRKRQKEQARCRICSIIVDVGTLDVSWEVRKRSWVCSDRCRRIYRIKEEKQRQKDKASRDKEIKANMKKYGKGFR